MTERDAFELRLGAAVHGYAGRVSSDLDATELAHRIATREPRRQGLEMALRWRGVVIPRLAWILLIAALLTALVAGMLVVGSQLQRKLPAVVPPVAPSVAPPAPQAFACPPGTNPDTPGPVDQARPLGLLKMAFDRDSARIVALAGQYDGGSGAWETWTFDVCTNSWARARPDREPAVVASRETQLVHDADSDLTIAIGPPDGRPWIYDLEANSWTAKGDSLAAGSLSFAGSFRLAFDPVSGLVIVQVISSGDGWAPPQDLWTYDVETDGWVQVRQAGDMPPGTSGDHLLLAYDASVDRIVAFGASRRSTQLLDPRTGAWTRGAFGPSLNTGYWASGGEIAYDEARLRTVVFSDGLVGAYDATTDTWETLYGSSTCCGSGPLNRLLPAMVYDPVNERLVVAGGEYRTADGWVRADDVWAFDTATRAWTQLLAPSRVERYDAATDQWVELPAQGRP